LGELNSPNDNGSLQAYRDGKAVYINEHGAYDLAMQSKSTISKQFRKWLAHEVLPSIRRTGQYKLQNELDTLKEDGVKTRAMIAKLEQERLQLKKIIHNHSVRNPTQIVYISTSKSYAAQHRFKVGGMTSEDLLSKRLASYNTRSATGDEWYYTITFKVVDFHLVECILAKLLEQYKDKKSKEIYIYPYKRLITKVEAVCTNYEVIIKDTNNEIEEVSRELSLPATDIPQPLSKVEVKHFGLKVNLETVSEDRLLEIFSEFIPTNDKTTEIKRKDLFDGICKKYPTIKLDRRKAWPMLKQKYNGYLLKY
jgi:hypothetical protein